MRPRQGWRWAHRPPRMLHHEEMPAPVPPAPAPSLPTGFTVTLEGGTWSDQAQEKPGIGSAAEESTYLEAPHCIPMDAAERSFCCSRSRAKPESRLQNPAALCRLSKPGQTLAPGVRRSFARAVGQQQFLRTLQNLQTLQRLPQE